MTTVFTLIFLVVLSGFGHCHANSVAMDTPIDERQRDLFPLPFLDEHSFAAEHLRVCRRTARKVHGAGHATEWANDGILAFNLLANRGSAPRRDVRLSHASCAAAVNVGQRYVQLPPPPVDDVSGEGALSELLAKSSVFLQDRVDIASYSEAPVAWPEVGSAPIPLVEHLPPADRQLLSEWNRHLLRDEADAANQKRLCGLNLTHCDPELFKNTKVYSKFLLELHRRGVPRWRVARPGERGRLGILFVWQNDGTLRIVFDTRMLNTDFVRAPSMRLPSGSSLAGTECERTADFFVGTGDTSCCYYHGCARVIIR